MSSFARDPLAHAEEERDTFFIDLNNYIVTIVTHETIKQAPPSQSGKYSAFGNTTGPPYPWGCWCPTNPNNSHFCPHEPSFIIRCSPAAPFPWGCWCPVNPNKSHLCPHEPTLVIGKNANYVPCPHSPTDTEFLHRVGCVRPASAAHKFIRWFRHASIWRQLNINQGTMVYLRDRLCQYYNLDGETVLCSPTVMQEHCELLLRIVHEFRTMRLPDGTKNMTWNPMVHGVFGWAELAFAECLRRVVKGMVEMKRLRLEHANGGKTFYLSGR